MNMIAIMIYFDLSFVNYDTDKMIQWSFLSEIKIPEIFFMHPRSQKGLFFYETLYHQRQPSLLANNCRSVFRQFCDLRPLILFSATDPRFFCFLRYQPCYRQPVGFTDNRGACRSSALHLFPFRFKGAQIDNGHFAARLHHFDAIYFLH